MSPRGKTPAARPDVPLQISNPEKIFWPDEGMNATHNALANASRANATIGRTTRLIILNLLHGVPGGLDRSTLGHPGKFTYCVAEDEDGSPWHGALTLVAPRRGMTSDVTFRP